MANFDIDTTSSDAELDAMFADEETGLPEVEVPLALSGKLRRQYEAVRERIEQRAAERAAQRAVDTARRMGLGGDAGGDDRLGVRRADPEAGASDVDPEQAELDRLHEALKKYVKIFILRALPSTDWNRLMEQHPPRKNASTGKLDERDAEGFNSSTYFPELVRRSIVSHDMLDDGRWAKFNDTISDAQFDRLVKAAVEVNRRDEDIPFSLLASGRATS